MRTNSTACVQARTTLRRVNAASVCRESIERCQSNSCSLGCSDEWLLVLHRVEFSQETVCEASRRSLHDSPRCEGEQVRANPCSCIAPRVLSGVMIGHTPDHPRVCHESTRYNHAHSSRPGVPSGREGPAGRFTIPGGTLHTCEFYAEAGPVGRRFDQVLGKDAPPPHPEVNLRWQTKADFNNPCSFPMVKNTAEHHK